MSFMCRAVVVLASVLIAGVVCGCERACNSQDAKLLVHLFEIFHSKKHEWICIKIVLKY